MNLILLARIAVLLAGSAVAAYTDAKTGLIPDKITYAMIAAGIALNLIEFDVGLFLVPVIVFAFGFALYWAGKIGGGDVKLFTGIAMLLPFLNEKVFIAHVLLAAAVLSIVFYSVYFVTKYARKGISLEENRQGIVKAVVLGAMIAAYIYYMHSAGFLALEAAIIFFATSLFALVFIAFEAGIKKNFFLKEIALGELEEDEVVAGDFLNQEIKEKLRLKGKGVLGEREIEKLRQAGVKRIAVYRNMPPFAPFILLGCIIVLAWPELFSFLLI